MATEVLPHPVSEGHSGERRNLNPLLVFLLLFLNVYGCLACMPVSHICAGCPQSGGGKVPWSYATVTNGCGSGDQTWVLGMSSQRS